MNWKRASVCGFIVLFAIGGFVAWRPSLAAGLLQRVKGKRTVAQRMDEFGAAARQRLKPFFDRAKVAYPPASVTLVGIKQAKRLELYAPTLTGEMRFVRAWPMLAASGKLGPKLQQGDQQVPEGVYAIESLNPNSLFHVALRVSYPNAFDRRIATLEGRSHLGGDIMIHGKSASIGCLAMGDPAAEEIFTLAVDTGLPRIRVVLSPIDFRLKNTLPERSTLPPWSDELYRVIRTELGRLPIGEAR